MGRLWENKGPSRGPTAQNEGSRQMTQLLYANLNVIMYNEYSKGLKRKEFFVTRLTKGFCVAFH